MQGGLSKRFNNFLNSTLRLERFVIFYCRWIPGEGRDALDATLLGEKVVKNLVRESHIITYFQNN